MELWRFDLSFELNIIKRKKPINPNIFFLPEPRVYVTMRLKKNLHIRGGLGEKSLPFRHNDDFPVVLGSNGSGRRQE